MNNIIYEKIVNHYLLKSLVLVSIICFVPETLNPQNQVIQFEHYSLEQGLSQNTVYCVLQDSVGFLWLGTADGLNRYDGYQFKVYKNDPADSTSLSANRIYALLEDKSGNLWVGTYGGGLNKFNRSADNFTHFKNNPEDQTSISDDEIRTIYEDHNNRIWIGTEGGGLIKFIPEKNLFRNYKNVPGEPGSLSENEILAICEDHLGYLWVGTRESGLNKLDIEKEKFILYRYNPNEPNSLSDDEILSIYEDRAGTLWIGTGSGGLNKFVRETNSFIRYKNNPANPYSISADRIFSISEDLSGNLWIGTMGGGLNKFIRNYNQFISFNSDPEISTSLSSNGIFSLFTDRTGILWIGTYGGGVNKLDQSKAQFQLYRNNPDNPNSLGSNLIFSICEDKSGNIWVGTAEGLNKFNRLENKFTRYRFNPGTPSGLSDDEVLAICQDRLGNLWIGTYGGGLNLFDREKNKFSHNLNKPDDENSLSDNKIFSIFEDSFGYLWIGTDGGGLNKFDKEKNEFTQYKPKPNETGGLNASRVFVIREDKDGNLWVGTDSGGLNKYERKNGKFIHYKHNPNDPGSLSNDAVLSIYESRSGDLWIGTYGGGLNRFNKSSESFEHFRSKDGLPNDVVWGILEDNSGNIWLSTNKGLSKFNPKTNSFRNYDLSDGLQGNEFNQGAYFKSKTGELIFGGPYGLNIINPETIVDNPHIPEIVLSDFQLLHKPVAIGYDTSWNRKILVKSVEETGVIELNHDDNVVSFEFSALDFRNPDKNKYAYIMEGFDKDWTYTDANRRFVTYTNLDPGEYFFRVKGSNNDGIWNEDGTSLKLVINPPWWITWWAYSLYTLFFLIVFVSSTRFYLNRQRLKHQLTLEKEHAGKLEEIHQMKSRFFANISHEFRTPLTLILGPAEKIARKESLNPVKDADLITKNSKRLLQLVNQLLDLSKLDAGKLNLNASPRNIVSFIKGTALSFESLSESKDIMLKIKSEKEFIEVYFEKEKMVKVISNLLSNAFKFTPESGSVLITIAEKENESVEIKIKNTGIGIPEDELPKLFDRFYQVDSSQTKEYEGTGIGLALAKELIELHHGTIRVESKEMESGRKDSAWTEFTIQLPLGCEHLKAEEIIHPKADQPSAELLNEKEITIEEEDFYNSKTLIESEIEPDETKTTILVVEDNYDMRAYIKESLSENYSIQEATNGEQGVRIAEKLIPDLIISDLMMPKMDGNELTRILKNDERTSHIPIILLTAKSGQENKIEGLQTGADDYLTKPFDLQELRVRVENLINIRKKLQEKFSKGEFLFKRTDKKLKNIDEKFLAKVIEVIEKHMSEEEFSIEECSNEVGMSRNHLYKKLKALVGKSPSQYVRTVRLHRAKQMIEEEKGNVSEIAYSVGFSSPAYFSRCFKEEFGYPPSDILT